MTTTLTNQDTVATAFLSGSSCTSSPLILLAEDNKFTAETMQDYLQFHGFRVNVAADGFEVIEQALADKPDLIIMDIQMPGLNGFEATHRLRLEPSMVDIPIIALTALAMAGDRERCLNAGANAYYSKPISLKQVMEIIRQFLSK
ncbi:MAG: response regulator [Caldilineaceae bacterium]